MENKIKMAFIKENKEIEIDIANPDLAKLIHTIVAEELKMSRENIEISTDVENFDTEELLDILLGVHEEFCEEIDTFYANIKMDIKTYYDDEILGEEIIRRIKEKN